MSDDPMIDAMKKLAARVRQLENLNIRNGCTLITQTTLSAPAARFDFTSIPQRWTNLRLLCHLRSSVVALSDVAQIQFNAAFLLAMYYDNDTTGNAGAVTSSGTAAATSARLCGIPGSSAPASCYGQIDASIPGYTQVHNPSFTAHGFYQTGSTAVTQWTMQTGGWLDVAAAVTSIRIRLPGVANFEAGSSVSLYGMA